MMQPAGLQCEMRSIGTAFRQREPATLGLAFRGLGPRLR